jgi:hypothetical protein
MSIIYSFVFMWIDLALSYLDSPSTKETAQLSQVGMLQYYVPVIA